MSVKQTVTCNRCQATTSVEPNTVTPAPGWAKVFTGPQLEYDGAIDLCPSCTKRALEFPLPGSLPTSAS